jgi:hypothetical protein
MTAGEFAAWAKRLGLERLSENDLAELHRGWLGLQPQVQRLRDGLRAEDLPPKPPLGA